VLALVLVLKQIFTLDKHMVVSFGCYIIIFLLLLMVLVFLMLLMLLLLY